jgi:hypothetical protein
MKKSYYVLLHYEIDDYDKIYGIFDSFDNMICSLEKSCQNYKNFSFYYYEINSLNKLVQNISGEEINETLQKPIGKA